MALILTQTDTDADSGFNVGCSGQSAGNVTVAREATDGGTSGTTEVLPDPGLGVERAVLAFQSDAGGPEPNDTTWEAGDYVVRINVTTARSNSQWTETYICERTSGGTFNTVASLTGQTTSLGATGVKTHTVNRATDYTAGSASTIYIVVVISDTNAHGQSKVGITPDQNIDTPIASATEKTITVSLDAAVQMQKSLAASLDAGIAKAQTRTASLDAALRAVRTAATQIDAALRDTITRQANLDAAVQDSFTRATALDAAVQDSFTRSTSLDAVLAMTKAAAVSLDGVLERAKTRDTGLEAAVQDLKSVSASFDAALAEAKSRSVVLDATIQRPQVVGTGLDAVIEGGATFAAAASRTHEVTARVRCTAPSGGRTNQVAARGRSTAPSGGRDIAIPPSKRRH